MPTFLVFRTDKIGDLVLSLPAAQAIKEARPGASVVFVVSPGTSEIARACPFVDSVIEYDESQNSLLAVLLLARQLRQARAETAVFLRPTIDCALAGLLAGIPTRVGTAYRYYSILFNRRVREHRRFADKHETEYNLNLARAVIDLKSRTYTPKIVVPNNSNLYAQRELDRFGLERGSFVIIHPGSAGSARNLTAKSYAKLVDLIEDELGIKSLVTAGSQEVDIVREIDVHRGVRSRSLMGAPSLLDLVA